MLYLFSVWFITILNESIAIKNIKLLTLIVEIGYPLEIVALDANNPIFKMALADSNSRANNKPVIKLFRAKLLSLWFSFLFVLIKEIIIGTMFWIAEIPIMRTAKKSIDFVIIDIILEALII